uniref:Helix-turn-helix domain protein n=1 Tax=Caudovirales sp. ctkvU4 TaxID=2826783 RepID=A0A8S5QQW3_9CAUD|nr:MAG TPA: helix-turn-helix domain protein [Caudovirales sp. ctkvU4]
MKNVQLIKIQDYTEKCGLPESTIRRYCREGILPAMQIGRRYYIDEPEADAILKDKVKLSTAQRRASPNMPELCRQKSSKKFDFLKALTEA